MSNQETPFKTPLKLSDVDGRPCLIDHNNQVVAFGVWSQVSVSSVAEDVRLLSGIRDRVNAHDKLVAGCEQYRKDLLYLREHKEHFYATRAGPTAKGIAARLGIVDAALALADPAMDAVCEGLTKDARIEVDDGN